jgi:hypothetical protein
MQGEADCRLCAGEGVVLNGSAATIRFLISYANVFFSLILGVIAMGLFFIYLPDETVRLQRIAASVHEWIMAFGWSTRVESILRFILEGRQLLLMGFVLASRFVLGIVILVCGLLFHRLKLLLLGDDEPAAGPKAR